jgi:NAD(P)-dependent dehydrogenase (short-subunit alcohol dehydrogenase family)
MSASVSADASQTPAADHELDARARPAQRSAPADRAPSRGGLAERASATTRKVKPMTSEDQPRDQYTFGDPVTRYPNIHPPVQQQSEPGLQSEMDPVPDLGEETYRGTGRLEGRRALITGGDSGIGAAVAIAFAREGADIALCYLPEEEGDADHVVRLIEEAGRKAVRIPGDITDAAFCRRLVTAAVEGLGGLDAVVNVAGKQIWQTDIADITDEQFEATYRTNVFAPFWIIKAALPHLEPGSTIINTASAEAYTPAPDRLDYASTKGAINNFSKGLSQQLAPKGIRVNVVAPGPTWTALQVTQGVDPETLPEFGSSEAPLGRSGQPAEIAPAYVFLASAESSFVIGTTLSVNGGMPTP